MKKSKLLIVAAAVLAASAFTLISAVSWKVKDTYSVKCSAGTFKGLKASILFDEEQPEKSKITASIEAATINSGNSLKNSHAREALETDKFPLITFESTAIAKTATGYEATGNLTLKGVTKKITFPFVFDSKKMSPRFPFVDKEIFNGIITIVPKDYGITKAGTPGEVTIELNIPVTQ